MKFEIAVKSLREALERIQPFSRNSSARIVASESSVTISCFSRQHGMFAKTSIPGAIVDKAGAICVEFDRLMLAAKLGKEILFAKANANALAIRSGNMSLNVNLAEEVPEPEMPDCTLRYHVDAQGFASAVKPLATLAGNSSLARNTVLSGVYLEEYERRLQLVATDGNALYLTNLNSTTYPEGEQFTEEVSTIVPPHLISAILSALQQNGELAIGRTDSAFIIGQPGLVAFGTLQTGKYPPWRRILETDATPQVECLFSDLKGLIDSARLFHANKFGAARLSVDGDALTLSTQNETSGYKDSIKCKPLVEGFSAFCYFDITYGKWFDLSVDDPATAIVKITLTEEEMRGNTAKKLRFDVDANTELILCLSGEKYRK